MKIKFYDGIFESNDIDEIDLIFNMKLAHFKQRTEDLFNVMEKTYIKKQGTVNQNIRDLVSSKNAQLNEGIKNGFPSESLYIFGHESEKLNPYFNNILNKK